MSTPHRPDPRFLTLFVDASFCHRTHAAGYGAWAKKAAFAKGLIFGGPLPRGISNAGEAELGGIALALRFLLEREHPAGLDRLMVQSDSLRSLQLISQVLPRVRIANHADAATVTKALVAIKARVDRLDLLLRHVQGHKRAEAAMGEPDVRRQGPAAHAGGTSPAGCCQRGSPGSPAQCAYVASPTKSLTICYSDLQLLNRRRSFLPSDSCSLFPWTRVSGRSNMRRWSFVVAILTVLLPYNGHAASAEGASSPPSTFSAPELDASATDQERLILRIQRQLNSIPDHPAYLYEIRRPLDAPAIIWMDWTSRKRDAYELHYFTAIDYIELERITLLRAQHLAHRRLLDDAAALLKDAARLRNLANAFERASIAIFESDLANAELWATTAYELSRAAAVVTGAHAAPLSPVLAKAVDYLFIATDAFVSWHQVDASTALKEAVNALAIKLLLTEIPVPAIEAASGNPFVQSFNQHFAGRTFEDALADGATALIEWDLKPYVLEAVSSPAFKEELRKQFVAQLVSVAESGIESIVARADATIDQIIRGIELGLAERGELDLLADANCGLGFTKVLPGQMACGLGLSRDTRLIIGGQPVTDVVQPWGSAAEHMTIYPLPTSQRHAVVVFGGVLPYVVDVDGRRATEVFVAKYGPDQWISWGPDDRYVALLGGNEGLTWLHVISLGEHTNHSVPSYDSRLALVFDEESFSWLGSNSFRVRLAECKGEYCGETTLPRDGTAAQFHVSDGGIAVIAIDDLSKVPVDLARMIAPAPESTTPPADAEAADVAIPEDRIELDDGTVIVGAAGAVSLPFASAFGTLQIAIGEIAGFAEETLTLADGSVLKGRFGESAVSMETTRGTIQVPAGRIVALSRARVAASTDDSSPGPQLPPGQGLLTGQVIDQPFGRPLADAQVRVDGTSFHTTTDRSGNFQIPYVPGNIRLIVSHAEYKNVEFDFSIGAASVYPASQLWIFRDVPHDGAFYRGTDGWIALNRCHYDAPYPRAFMQSQEYRFLSTPTIINKAGEPIQFVHRERGRYHWLRGVLPMRDSSRVVFNSPDRELLENFRYKISNIPLTEHAFEAGEYRMTSTKMDACFHIRVVP